MVENINQVVKDSLVYIPDEYQYDNQWLGTLDNLYSLDNGSLISYDQYDNTLEDAYGKTYTVNDDLIIVNFHSLKTIKMSWDEFFAEHDFNVDKEEWNPDGVEVTVSQMYVTTYRCLKGNVEPIALPLINYKRAVKKDTIWTDKSIHIYVVPKDHIERVLEYCEIFGDIVE